MLEKNERKKSKIFLSLAGKISKNFPFTKKEKPEEFPNFPHREKVEKIREFPREGKTYILKYIFFPFPSRSMGVSSCATAYAQQQLLPLTLTKKNFQPKSKSKIFTDGVDYNND